MSEELTLIETVAEVPAGRHSSQTQRPPAKFRIVQIREEVESIKARNQQRKRQFGELFNKRSMMKTLTQKKPRYSGNVSLEVPSKRTSGYINPQATFLYDKKRPSLAHGDSNRIRLPAPSIPTERHRYERQALRRYDMPTLRRKPKVKQLSNEQSISTYFQQLQTFESIYETLSGLLANVRGTPNTIAHHIKKYTQNINSADLLFIDDFVEDTGSASIKKVLKLSRALENLTVVYLALELIGEGKEKSYIFSHAGDLTNLIGHAAANITLLARLFMLSHQIEADNISQTKFEQAIVRFEEASYGEQMTDFEQVLTRIQHNNDILMILELKVGRDNPDFENRIRTFIKNLQRGGYSCNQIFFFLFEYLACYLHVTGLVNILPMLDTAPRPFLVQTDKPYTICIDPQNVLIDKRGSKYYLRSFTSQFLQFLSGYAEVILWTTSLPTQAEPLLRLIDPEHHCSQHLYVYHCVHDSEDPTFYIKDVRMLGRGLDNVLIIASDAVNFKATPENGIVMNWGGNEKDRKLLDLSQILTEMFKQKLTVQEIMTKKKAEIEGLQNPKKIRRKLQGLYH